MTKSNEPLHNNYSFILSLKIHIIWRLQLMLILLQIEAYQKYTEITKEGKFVSVPKAC